MTVEMFLTLLSAFSALTGLIVEAIKKIAKDRGNLSYNLMAFITAVIVGGAGTATYYYLNDVAFTGKNIVFAILLGLASGLVSQIGFDKLKGILYQLGLIQE